MSQIKWAYDESTGSFSALPASPWLLPVLGLMCLAPLIEYIWEKADNAPKPLPADFDYKLHAKYKDIYLELKHKEKQQGYLDSWDRNRLVEVQNPPWALPGEIWTYH